MFGQWICTETWSDLEEVNGITPTEQVERLENLLNKKLKHFLPTKSVRVNPFIDKPYITAELKKLDRQIKREYRRNRKSFKYLEMKKSFDKKMKLAARNYLNKNVRDIMDEEPGKAYKCLRKLAAKPGDDGNEKTFSILSHVNENLTTEESVERIAQFFADISQEFAALNIEKLPADVQTKLKSDIRSFDLPEVSDYEIYKVISQSKKPRSSVPGDIPRKLVQDFAPELAAPVGKIFRNIISTGHWPKQ